MPKRVKTNLFIHKSYISAHKCEEYQEKLTIQEHLTGAIDAKLHQCSAHYTVTNIICDHLDKIT